VDSKIHTKALSLVVLNELLDEVVGVEYDDLQNAGSTVAVQDETKTVRWGFLEISELTSSLLQWEKTWKATLTTVVQILA